MKTVRRESKPRQRPHVHVWREMHNPEARACVICGAVRVQLELPLYQRPTVTPVGNLNDVMAYVGGGS